jgi:anti-sigma factor RsiW
MQQRNGSGCDRISDLLSDYSVGAITAHDRLLVEQHLAECTECTAELMALEQVGVLLNRTSLEPAPDLWHAIRPNLIPRHERFPFHRVFEWLSHHRVQSAACAMAATAAIGAWLLVIPQQRTEVEARTYIAHHASLNWREPFADKVGLGLADTPYTRIDVEEVR